MDRTTAHIDTDHLLNTVEEQAERIRVLEVAIRECEQEHQRHSLECPFCEWGTEYGHEEGCIVLTLPTIGS